MAQLTMDVAQFESEFEALTGNAPFPWQAELYRRFLAGSPPRVVHLPTGVGKTRVIAIWWIALQHAPDVMPRRLVYVVNRRTVVDQTTVEVERLRENLQENGKQRDELFNVSTLRGQLADNETWAADPSRPAVICGTVDMIGSRLLFEGYRIGPKKRPLHAGILGQDALLVHDEAHLEPAFQEIVTAVAAEQQRERARSGELPWPGLKVMELSATTRGSKSDNKPLTLSGEDHENEVIHQRIHANKTLQLHACRDDKRELVEQLFIKCSEHQASGDAILVFAREVAVVEAVVDKLTHKKQGIAPSENVCTLTGTIRGLERDQLADKNDVFARFLPESDRDENVTPAEGTVYLVCTSAGEVGVNLSADHMVSDLSTFDSMAQRLGRVNRFGKREKSRIDVMYPESFDPKHPLTLARERTLALLKELNGDTSPARLDELPSEARKQAFAPEPAMLTATDILFDAWAMTSIQGPMPGRPPVAPYLHGVAEWQPKRTTVAWRAELDLLDRYLPTPEQALQTIFAHHRIRLHETLSTRSKLVEEFLKKLKRRTDLHGVRVVLQLPRQFVLTTIGQLVQDPSPLDEEPTLILPASLGGLDDNGMLSASYVRKAPPEQNGQQEPTTPPASHAGHILDVADCADYEPRPDLPARLRVLIERNEDNRWKARDLSGGTAELADWQLADEYETSTQLVNALRRQGRYRVRCVQAVKQDGDGNDLQSLVCLAPNQANQTNQVEQSLADHVAMVVAEAERLADALDLPEPFRTALLFAAQWHDEGKRAPVWQRYIGGPDASGEPLGKSAKWRNPRLLAGYRHEFGSLVRLDTPADWQLECEFPTDAEATQLALHLIAAHHGYGRPGFQHTVVEGSTHQQEAATHLATMRSYAHLQRRYGRWGLAYLESLLRAADIAASRAAGQDAELESDSSEEATP